MRWTTALALAAVMAGGGAALGACASDDGPKDNLMTANDWVGGDPAHLAADKTACRDESASVDPNQAAGYSDPRYGMTSAMGAAIQRDNPLTDTRPQQRQAAFAACMSDKGWHQP